MLTILTGIKATGRPHLGNIIGVIKHAIKLSKNNNSLFFIADLHSLTTIKKINYSQNNIFEIAATWLSFGLNDNKTIFYRQSKIPEVCELSWYLNCLTPYPMLKNAHAFKKEKEKLFKINIGLFTYPILMASDILLYNANIIPIGKDQLQHLEITQSVAKTFNKVYGKTFNIPISKLNKKKEIIPGIDGKKMSKSYDNTIDIFLSKKLLKKQIMNIKTNSIPILKTKNPNECNVFKLHKALSDKKKSNIMHKRYIKGDYGYNSAKKLLYELILKKFNKERILFQKYIKNIKIIKIKLKNGERKAKKIAFNNIKKIKSNMNIN